MSNQKVYVSNCKTGIVIKNNSYFESQSYVTVSGCIESGVMVLNNSTLNCSRNVISSYAAGNEYNLTTFGCPVGIAISNNSVGNIKCACVESEIGVIFSDNSSGEIWYGTFLASNTNKSGKFYSAVYVQDSNVMLRDCDDTSGWGSLTASTGPTNYRVNGGVIYVVTNEGTATPGISDISIGPRGGNVIGIDTAYTDVSDILDKINTDQYYYQKMT